MKIIDEFRSGKGFSVFIAIIVVVLSALNCTREKIIIYKPLTSEVELIYPPDDDLVFAEFPDLEWQPVGGAISYQVQVAVDIVFRETVIDSVVFDTSFTYDRELDNATYYWRIRAQSDEHIWGDWSDASIWSFIINNNSNYIELATIVYTPGTAQDLYICDNIAYVADGQKLLTLIDVSNPETPVLIGNLDREDSDFARAVWKLPNDDIVYVADTDGKIMALDTSLPLDPHSNRSLSIGFSQNLYNLTGTVYRDTIYLFSVGVGFQHRELFFTKITYDNGRPVPDHYTLGQDLFADGKGVYFDSMAVTVDYYRVDTLLSTDSTYYETQIGRFIFAAATENGLGWFDVSATHTFDGLDTLILNDPRALGWSDSPSLAQNLFIRDGLAYVADDRGGLQIYDIPDTIPAFDHDSLYAANPVLIGNVNTSGRTKDVHVVGNYCFIADGAAGLKVIDITNPYAPIFLAAYDTQYAYGVWADNDYIYLCDRDFGLMIFRNKL